MSRRVINVDSMQGPGIRRVPVRPHNSGSHKAGYGVSFPATPLCSVPLRSGPSTRLRTGPSTRLRTGLTRILRLRCTPLRSVPLRSGRTVGGRFAQGKRGPSTRLRMLGGGRACPCRLALRRGSGQGLRASFDFAALRYAPFRFAQDER